jgi:hypothetical protein
VATGSGFIDDVDIPEWQLSRWRGAIGWLVWGLFLVGFGFKIDGIDILPDIIGFAMIISACGTLRRTSRRFGTGQLFAVVGAIFWFMSLAREFAEILWFGPIAHIFLIWSVLAAVADYSRLIGYPGSARQIYNARGVYVFAYIILLVAATGGAGQAAFFLVFVNFFVLVWMLSIVHGIGKLRARVW